jgi:hypothetical protein
MKNIPTFEKCTVMQMKSILDALERTHDYSVSQASDKQELHVPTNYTRREWEMTLLAYHCTLSTYCIKQSCADIQKANQILNWVSAYSKLIILSND